MKKVWEAPALEVLDVKMTFTDVEAESFNHKPGSKKW
ncbi:paeninodin family lasso peptide [Paenibacillus sp. YAF4_2]